MNGDGRDELLLFSEGRFWAWDGELKDVWSWRTTLKEIDAILHSAKGHPSEVVLSQAFALDGATGRPRWAGKGLPAHDAEESPRILEGLRRSRRVERCSAFDHERPWGDGLPRGGADG